MAAHGHFQHACTVGNMVLCQKKSRASWASRDVITEYVEATGGSRNAQGARPTGVKSRAWFVEKWVGMILAAAASASLTVLSLEMGG